MLTTVKHNRTISKLCFGTAQLGMPYGIANRTGMPDQAAAIDLLLAAAAAGVTAFDTARDYGESETRLGMAAQKIPKAAIVTKLSALEELPESAVDAKVEESVHASLQCLGLPSLPYLLLHRAEHLHAHGGKIWQRLLALRKQGLIGRLGVSVQNPQEARDSINIKDVECIQLPFNALDWRYEQAGIPILLSSRPEILVFARSVLLQGLLTQPAAAWPVVPAKEAQEILQDLDVFTKRYKRKNLVELCLAYVRSQPWINSVVLGMENKLQLQENLEMFATPPLSEAACRDIRERFSSVDEKLLNPACWPREEHNAYSSDNPGTHVVLATSR